MKKMILGAMAGVLVLSGLLATPAWAVTCPGGTAREGKEAKNYSECNLVEDNSLWSTVGTIINVVVGALGVVAVLVIILGAIQITTSAGDPGKAAKGKNTIVYGIIGLVVAMLAFAIVNFVLSSLSKTEAPKQDAESSKQG